MLSRHGLRAGAAALACRTLVATVRCRTSAKRTELGPPLTYEAAAMLKFYYSLSPNPMKVALFLEEAGLP